MDIYDTINKTYYKEEGKNNMEIKLITGLSGAGKSTLINYFEQEGYQCHDDWPW